MFGYEKPKSKNLLAFVENGYDVDVYSLEMTINCRAYIVEVTQCIEELIYNYNDRF